MQHDSTLHDPLDPSNVLTVPEAVRALLGPDAKPAFGYRLARDGRLPGAYKVGRLWRVRRDALLEFIQKGGEPLPGGWRRTPKESR